MSENNFFRKIDFSKKKYKKYFFFQNFSKKFLIENDKKLYTDSKTESTQKCALEALWEKYTMTIALEAPHKLR
jgi:hypothetical protein